MNHFCKEASQLASDVFERDLTFIERLRLRLHLAMCDACGNYASSLNLLNKIFSITRQQKSKEDEACLSDEDRKRIETALKQATHPDH